MDFELIKKIDELIEIFENSNEIKDIDRLKKEIYNNQELKEKINKFNKLKDNPYSTEIVNIRRDILSIEEVKKYKELENEILLLTMAINKKLNGLTAKKGCNHENN